MGTGCSKHQGGFRSCGISSLTWGTEHIIRVKINTLSRLEETQNKPQQAFPLLSQKSQSMRKSDADDVPLPQGDTANYTWMHVVFLESIKLINF